jgi:hypothetical protein
MKAGQRVATIDLDSRQKSLTHYAANRHAWAKRAHTDLELAVHFSVRAERSTLTISWIPEAAQQWVGLGAYPGNPHWDRYGGAGQQFRHSAIHPTSTAQRYCVGNEFCGNGSLWCRAVAVPARKADGKKDGAHQRFWGYLHWN